MMDVLFATEIASMHGVVVKKNMRRQVQTDGQTTFQLCIYDMYKSY